MKERLSIGDVLCGSASDACFLVIDAGTAAGMPFVTGAALERGRPRPCSAAPPSTALFELEGGRRYVDPITGLTLLCVWPGRGPLCYEGRRLVPHGPDAAAAGHPCRMR
jgi:hypothetical protein